MTKAVPPPAIIAAADQAMKDTADDLAVTLATVRSYLADGHTDTEAWISLLHNFREALKRGRPETVASIAAFSILRLANANADAGGDHDHVYLSTSCRHHHHTQCGTQQHDRGEPGQPHCKHCPAPCICPCHTPERPAP